MHSEISSSLGTSIVLGQDDFDLMDAALHVVPELRTAVAAAKLVRDSEVSLPITSRDQLAAAIPNGHAMAAGHLMTPQTVELFVPDEHLPIDNEYDLLVKLYIAFLRCKMETAAATNIRPGVLAHASGDKQ
jgi:hypothetical protein